METKKNYNHLNSNTSASSYNSSNMVVSARPNSSNGISIINYHSSSTNNSNDSRNGGSSYHRQHSNNKYAHKSRNGGDEFIMLQRPTPIILAKPTPSLSTSFNKLTTPDQDRIESKDENSKPQLAYSRSTTPAVIAGSASLQANKQGVNVKLLNEQKNGMSTVNKANGFSQPQHNLNTPILASLSTNLASHSGSKVKQAQSHQVSSKDMNGLVPVAANPAVVTPSISTQNMTMIESLNVRLSNNIQPMVSSVKLLDENLQWQDTLLEFMCDQPDFLVVGVLGKKGVGKSTLMSLLAGSKYDENSQMLFKTADCIKTATKDFSDLAQHKTNGIQAFITSERTILLDVQPLLSGSVLDKTINMDKKHLNNDFKYYENYIEIQSIELACFILSVCNVVIVLEDWFFDPNLFRILQTAEMLMPQSSLSQQEEYQLEHHPHLVYALNKIDYLNKENTVKMKSCIDKLLHDSKLVYKGSINEINGLHLTSKIQRRNNNQRSQTNSVNFVAVPKAEKSNKHAQNASVTEYDGMPSLDRCIKHLLREILSVKRSQSTMNPLSNVNGPTNANSNSNNLVFSEKRWFSHANKVWDTIRKSQLIGEYNRLMT